MEDQRKRLLAIAHRQYGVFTKRQATECGYSDRMIRRRIESGRWLRLHPHVFAHAAAPSNWYRDQLAACLWSKGFSASAAAGKLHGLPGCDDPPIEIVTTRRRKMPMNGVVVHHTTRLPPEHVTLRASIPVTSVERTLMDLCGRFSLRRAAIAVDAALRKEMTTLGALDRCLYLSASRGRNGCAVLRNLIRERESLTSIPESPLETVIWNLFFSSGLPLPIPQYEIRDRRGGFVARVDFAYPEEKIVIEAHSKTWHWGARAHSDDAVRHNKIAELGYTIVYLTWADATRRGEQTVRLVERLLNHASQPAT